MKAGNGRKLNVPLPKVPGMKVVVIIKPKFLISEDMERGLKADVWYYATILLTKHDPLEGVIGWRLNIRGYETFLAWNQCILVRSCSIKDTLQPAKIKKREVRKIQEL